MFFCLACICIGCFERIGVGFHLLTRTISRYCVKIIRKGTRAEKQDTVIQIPEEDEAITKHESKRAHLDAEW